MGHVVTSNGIKPNPNQIKCIEHLNLTIQSFLGLSDYYRKFIAHYAKMAKPLTTRLEKDSKIYISDHDYKESIDKLRTITICH